MSTPAETTPHVLVNGKSLPATDAVPLLESLLAPSSHAENGPVDRCDLLLALGEALSLAGDNVRAAAEVLPEALALAEQASDERRAGRACWLALKALYRDGVGVHWRTAAHDRWAEPAVRHLPEGTLEGAWVGTAMVGLHATNHRWDLLRPTAQRALDQARRLGDAEAIFIASDPLLGQGWVAPHNGHERPRLAAELLTVPRDGVAPRIAASTLFNAATALTAWGQRSRAAEVQDALKELADTSHDPALPLFSMRLQSLFALLDGHLQDAIDLAGQTVAEGGKLGLAGLGLSLGARVPLRPSLLLGRAREMLVSESYRSRGSGQERSLIHAHAGLYDEARIIRDSVMQEWRIGPEVDGTPTGGLVRLLETSVLLGDREVAGFLLKRLRPLAPAIDDTQPTCVARHLGSAAALMGDREGALVLYRQALDVAEAVRFRPEAALTHLQLAEFLVAQGSDALATDSAALRADALGHLEVAIPEFSAMHMAPSLDRATALKDQLTRAPDV